MTVSYVSMGPRRTRESSILDRRGREIGRGSARLGFPRGAAPLCAISDATVTMLARRHPSWSSTGSAASRSSSAACCSCSRLSASCRLERSRNSPTDFHISSRISASFIVRASAAVRPRRSAPSPEHRRRQFGVTRRPGHRAARARAEHQAFEQRIAGEAVRAVHARARHLARGKQPGHRRAAVEIGFDAAHHVVRCRPDRNEIAREIEPCLQTRRGDHRKPPVHLVSIEMAQAEKNRAAAPPGLERRCCARRRRAVRDRRRDDSAA